VSHRIEWYQSFSLCGSKKKTWASVSGSPQIGEG
jgi:hypothetical protein